LAEVEAQPLARLLRVVVAGSEVLLPAAAAGSDRSHVHQEMEDLLGVKEARLEEEEVEDLERGVGMLRSEQAQRSPLGDRRIASEK